MIKSIEELQIELNNLKRIGASHREIGDFISRSYIQTNSEECLGILLRMCKEYKIIYFDYKGDVACYRSGIDQDNNPILMSCYYFSPTIGTETREKYKYS